MSGMIGSDVAYGAPPDDGGPASEGGGRAYAPPSYGGRGGYGGGGNAGRDRRPGGRGGGQREGDWVCPNTSCGNVNFARRVECNKCGTAKPAGGGPPAGQNSGFGGSGNRGNRSSGYGGGDGNTGYSGGNNYGSQGAPGSYGAANEYGSQSGGGGYGAGNNFGGGGSNYGSHAQGNLPPAGNAYSGQTGAAGGGQTYGDSRGGRGSYDSYGSERGSSYPDTRGDYGREEPRSVSNYGGSEPAKIKQCDENCGETCDNSRIYISGLPLDVTIDELRDLFGGIGQVARIKQKRGYKDQWPWNIKIYRDDAGKNKGDAVLSYEDPSAAHSAGGFFNDYTMRGHNIKVSMAEKSAPRPSAGGYGQGSGGDRGGGYGGQGGPDRRFGDGGHRSRPY